MVARGCRHVQEVMRSLLVRTALLLLLTTTDIGGTGVLLEMDDQSSP